VCFCDSGRISQKCRYTENNFKTTDLAMSEAEERAERNLSKHKFTMSERQTSPLVDPQRCQVAVFSFRRTLLLPFTLLSRIIAATFVCCLVCLLVCLVYALDRTNVSHSTSIAHCESRMVLAKGSRSTMIATNFTVIDGEA
jgi:hypothetical protein